jgi:hypothetical protein
MKILKAIFLALLAGLLIAGCSSTEKTEKAEKTEEPGPPSPGVAIDYTLIVSGLPMLEDMTFNYRFLTDGQVGKMSSESIIPAGDQVRTTKLSYVTNLETGTQTFLNDVTKTYASIDIPDPSTTPPSTGPEATIQMDTTGNTKMIAGAQCREVNVMMEISKPAATEEGTTTTTVTGNLWVSNDFDGYSLYDDFQVKLREAIGESRVQGSGYFEFLTRSGFSRDNLNMLYETINGFPMSGTLELALNQGSSRPANMTTKIDVTAISTDPMSRSVFGVPEGYTEVDIGQVNRP